MTRALGRVDFICAILAEYSFTVARLRARHADSCVLALFSLPALARATYTVSRTLLRVLTAADAATGRLHSIGYVADATTNIFPWSDKLKMRGVDTGVCPAQMIRYKLGRRRGALTQRQD